MNATSNSNLLNLSAELRVTIYRHLIPLVPTKQKIHEISGLLQSCHLVNTELRDEILTSGKGYIARVKALWPHEAPLIIDEPLHLKEMEVLRIGIPRLPNLEAFWASGQGELILSALFEHLSLDVYSYGVDIKGISAGPYDEVRCLRLFQLALHRYAGSRQSSIAGGTSRAGQNGPWKLQVRPDLRQSSASYLFGAWMGD
jgi:hypothetical protein